MSRGVGMGLVLVALVVAGPVAAAPPRASQPTGFEAAVASAGTSAPAPLALRAAAEAAGAPAPVQGLGAERAQTLLRSLTVPGWGQAALGRRGSARVFGLIEAGIWGSFVGFRVQEILRRHTYEKTASTFAGIDLDDLDEEFRRIVGLFPSSDDYNRLVIYRDAANLYYDDPDAYLRYIAENSLQGDQAWAWVSPESYARYQDERQATRRAGLRANAMLGLAIANRLVSAIHAARYAGAPQRAPAQSWRIECGPRGGDAASLALGVHLRF